MRNGINAKKHPIRRGIRSVSPNHPSTNTKRLSIKIGTINDQSSIPIKMHNSINNNGVVKTQSRYRKGMEARRRILKIK